MDEKGTRSESDDLPLKKESRKDPGGPRSRGACSFITHRPGGRAGGFDWKLQGFVSQCGTNTSLILAFAKLRLSLCLLAHWWIWTKQLLAQPWRGPDTLRKD
jgi:hypothetical protein